MRVCGGARQARNACVRAPCPAPGYPHPHPPQAAKRAGVRRSLAAPHAALVGPPARSPQCPRFRTLTSSHAARALGDRWGRGHTHCRRIWTSSAKQLQLHLTAPGARTVPTGAGGAHVHAAVRPPPSLTAAALCGWRVELHQQLCGARPAAAHHRWPASPAQPYTHRRMAGLFGVARVHKQHIRWTQQAQYAAEKLKRTSCPLQSGGMGSHT